MTPIWLPRRAALIGGASLLATPSLTRAQTWRPRQPVRTIIAAAAAGTLDIHARAAAPVISQGLGQTLVLENNGGAAGRVASAMVGRATPDGHTLLVASGDGIVISDILYGRAQGMLRSRLKPVTMTITAAQLLVTHPNSGIRSVEDYVARARQEQGLTLGVPGHGGIAHLISEMLNRGLGKMRVVHVPYRGGGPATLDLLAGQIDAMIITLPAVTDHVRSGRLRPLAVSTLQRDPAMPDVPALAEAAIAGFDVPSTQGVLVPEGTPDAVIDAWSQAWRAALQTPTVAQKLTDLGFVIAATTPIGFQESLEAANSRFSEVIAAAGIKAEDA
ncbi:tripartite tricarboxylate transporter substrate binding protein [Siccirubricoccus sp. G192]|uniref:Bug family tripartite tricarboxylate transporter substrate binding protein n=1 Tax=Siccirubricoccus sp. G192 TaxID=2849651 RepID=UPI001C2C6774|nr:tripartite tricarboxylate transporter substrate binding protein [Siccirubricoccus sp. G192]MBV1798690.1 tripartite tricarboxylate transporter substrate binding protein [Siccirubricoccus sp. G192]